MGHQVSRTGLSKCLQKAGGMPPEHPALSQALGGDTRDHF